MQKLANTRSSGSLIGRLPEGALKRIDADCAEHHAQIVDALGETRGQMGPLVIELAAGISVRIFDSVARECLNIATSSKEFTSALQGEIVEFCVFFFTQLPFVGRGGASKEVEAGFAMAALNIPGWMKASPEDLRRSWHVGATVGQAISQRIVAWRAAALRAIATAEDKEIAEQKAISRKRSDWFEAQLQVSGMGKKHFYDSSNAPRYNTMKNWLNGISTTQVNSVRRNIADVFKIKISEVSA
jgi:hypothetical protein